MNIRKIIREEIDKIMLFEEKGVPEEVIKATRKVVDRLVRYEKTILDDEWHDIESKDQFKIKAKSFKDESIFFHFYNLFFDGLSMGVEFLKLNDVNSDQRIKTNSTKGEILRDSVRFNFDKSKIKVARINLRICYTNKIDELYVYGTISHELTHLYEVFKRKEPVVSKKHMIYNQIKYNYQIYLFFSKYLNTYNHLFYLFCY